MLVQVELFTKPKSILRLEASKIAMCHPTTIDKAIRENRLDHAKHYREVFVINNKKWREFKEQMILKFNK